MWPRQAGASVCWPEVWLFQIFPIFWVGSPGVLLRRVKNRIKTTRTWQEVKWAFALGGRCGLWLPGQLWGPLGTFRCVLLHASDRGYITLKCVVFKFSFSWWYVIELWNFFSLIQFWREERQEELGSENSYTPLLNRICILVQLLPSLKKKKCVVFSLWVVLFWLWVVDFCGIHFWKEERI